MITQRVPAATPNIRLHGGIFTTPKNQSHEDRPQKVGVSFDPLTGAWIKDQFSMLNWGVCISKRDEGIAHSKSKIKA